MSEPMALAVELLGRTMVVALALRLPFLAIRRWLNP